MANDKQPRNSAAKRTTKAKTRVPTTDEPVSTAVATIATERNAIIEGNARLLFTGIQLAGPDLTPENFRAGIFAAPLPKLDATHLRETVSFGDHGLWPKGSDYGGADDYAIVWWNPDASGQDETGAKGKGLYETVQGGRRFLIGTMGTAPLGLFAKPGSVAYFDDGSTGCDVCLPVPDALRWTGPTYPAPNLGG